MGSEIILRPHWLDEGRRQVPKVAFRAERADGSDSGIDSVINGHMVVASPELRLSDVHPSVIKQTKVATKNMEDAVVRRGVQPEEIFEGPEIERVYSEICLPAELFIKKIGNLYKIQSDQCTVNEKLAEIKRMMPGATVVSAAYHELPPLTSVNPKRLTMPVEVFKVRPLTDIPMKDFKLYLQQFGLGLDSKYVFSKYNFTEIRQPDPTVLCLRILDLRVVYLVSMRRLVIGGVFSKPIIIDISQEGSTFHITHNTFNIGGARHDYQVETAYLAMPEGAIKDQDAETFVREHLKALRTEMGDKIHEAMPAVAEFQIERIKKVSINCSQPE